MRLEVVSQALGDRRRTVGEVEASGKAGRKRRAGGFPAEVFGMEGCQGRGRRASLNVVANRRSHEAAQRGGEEARDVWSRRCEWEEKEATKDPPKALSNHDGQEWNVS